MEVADRYRLATDAWRRPPAECAHDIGRIDPRTHARSTSRCRAPGLLARYPDTNIGNARTTLNVPLVRGGRAIGVLSSWRWKFEPFTDREIALLETFADQAVIAIENARLFEELEQRNAELQESNRQVTEALEQQTATAEVLRVIAVVTDRPPARARHYRGELRPVSAMCRRRRSSIELRATLHWTSAARWSDRASDP